MQAATASASPSSPFLLCFRSLFDSGRGLAFPCDERGRVDLDALSEPARNDYFFARSVVGRDFAMPGVEMGALQ
jgi:hypothetical protein